MKTNPNQPERATTIHVGEDHDVTIEKIVYGGDGLARLGPFILFVPFTAPGDVVRVRITSVDRSIARGVIEQMISPANHCAVSVGSTGRARSPFSPALTPATAPGPN
jgi:predicted RNA-binding protein with TRAM domain